MASAGKDFEARIKRRLEQSGAHWVRIPDDPTHFMAASKSKEGPRFTPKRPFDGTATWWDDETGFLPVNLELKTCAGSRMEFSRVKRHQEFALASSIKGCAGVVIEFRSNNACYFMPIASFLETKDAIGKKSLNRSDLESLCDANQCVRMPQDTASRERRVYYSVEPIREWVRSLATSGIARARTLAYQEFLAQGSMSVEEWDLLAPDGTEVWIHNDLEFTEGRVIGSATESDFGPCVWVKSRGRVIQFRIADLTPKEEDR